MNKIETLNSLFGSDVTVKGGRVTVTRDAALASEAMDRLVRAAVFGDGDEKEHARWLIWELGQEVGVPAASPCPRSTCAAWRTTPRGRSSAPPSP
jgi:hypothetical protein